MKTDEWALLISILGAVLSVGTVVWNVFVFKKSGPVVVATLTMGTQGSGPDGVGTHRTEVAAKTWSRIGRLRSDADQHFFLTATNSGRAAIWIDSVGLRTSEEAITLEVSVGEGKPYEGFGPVLPYQLEAGQRARWALPLRQAWLISRPEVNGIECIHGRLTLGNGATLDTKEGIRVDLVRDAQARSAPRR